MELHNKTEMAGQASGINITAMEGMTKEISATQQVGDNQIKRNNSSGNNETSIPMPTVVELMHRVPEMLKKPQLRKYFEPRMVSLGPYPRKKKEFPVTKDNERKIKDLLLGDKRVEDSEEMRIALKNAKALYMANPKTSRIISDDFDDMMILDACFIIYVIDSIITKSWSVLGIRPHHLPLVVEDMFLLENQVPFGVLEAVTKFNGSDPQKMIIEFMHTITRDLEVPSPRTYFERIVNVTDCHHFHWTIRIPVLIVLFVVAIVVILVTLPREIYRDIRIEEDRKEINAHMESFMRDKKPLHLLQILRADLLFYSEEKGSNSRAFLLRPSRCATELKVAGINFECKLTNTIEDIKFKRGFIFGRLCLPSITHLTKGRLLNLIAYELGLEHCGYGITSYVCFLDGLIDHPEDVKELRSKNILPKGLGNDEEVANFFNMVGTDLALHAPSYYEVLRDIETHCYSEWRADMAAIYNKYFSSRLATISFVIATLLLLITIAQAYVALFHVKN